MILSPLSPGYYPDVNKGATRGRKGLVYGEVFDLLQEEDEIMATELTAHAPGTFCWVDLGTTDAAAAKKFYTALFGWTAIDMPAGPSVYTMMQMQGKDICALYEQDAEMRQRGVPPHWLSYVSVKDADEAARKAANLGGKVLKPAFEVMDVGRMAMVEDPTGAMFALWQPRKHAGAQMVNQPASLCWNELVTTDATKAGKFYTELFGWSSEQQTFGLPVSEPYTTFKNNERPAGGMMGIPPGAEDNPQWVAYFAVGNCDKTVEKAKELGATVYNPATDIPTVGRFAVLADPQGATFAVVQLLTPPG